MATDIQNTDQGSIDLYKALEEMKDISRSGGTFAIRFRKWDRQRKRGGGIVTINRARIRPKANDEKISGSSFKLFITDTENGRLLVCWQPLITEFNGKRIILN